jgi:hypothetical protein
MGVPANLQVDVNKLFARIDAAAAADPIRPGFLDDLLGAYADGLSSDGSQWIAVLSDFTVGDKRLGLNHSGKLLERIIPLGRDKKCPIDVFGFASNTTNAHWSHEQNRELAVDRMNEAVHSLETGGSSFAGPGSVPANLITPKTADSGETGDAGDENPDKRFVLIVVTLNGATPPAPLPSP